MENKSELEAKLKELKLKKRKLLLSGKSIEEINNSIKFIEEQLKM